MMGFSLPEVEVLVCAPPTTQQESAFMHFPGREEINPRYEC